MALHVKILMKLHHVVVFFETTFGFDLPKGHIMAWLKEFGIFK
jgi:hypothetical protein